MSNINPSYFTTSGSDFFHSTADCPAWKRGRHAGDGRNPVLPLTVAEAEQARQTACEECAQPDPRSST